LNSLLVKLFTDLPVAKSLHLTFDIVGTLLFRGVLATEFVMRPKIDRRGAFFRLCRGTFLGLMPPNRSGKAA
jgi:hypothetical protein